MRYKLFVNNRQVGDVSTTMELPNIRKVTISSLITMPATEYEYKNGKVVFDVYFPDNSTYDAERTARLGLKEYSTAYRRSLTERAYKFNRYTGVLREVIAQEFVNVNDKLEVIVKNDGKLDRVVKAELVDNKYQLTIRTDMINDPYRVSLELFHALKDIGVKFKCFWC